MRPLIATVATSIAALLAAAAGASAAPPLVSTFPIPGSRTASPQTQIAFRGIPAAQLGAITVSGSVSGVHVGRVAADSDGLGGSFLPATPFLPGEVVTVTTSLDVVHGRAGTFTFTIVSPAPQIPYHGSVSAPRARGDLVRFQSRTDLVPAAVKITRRSARVAPGDIFVAPQLGPVQDGPMILDGGGGLVWFKPEPPGTFVTDFKVQSYQSQPVLTWWQGNENAGSGRGVGVINNTSYQQIAVVRAANGLSEDLHDFEITSRNTALITAYYPVLWDTSFLKHGSKNAIVLDGVVQEIDIPTGLVLFQWDSLDHVGLAESIDPYPRHRGTPFDYFHVNSIQEDTDGSLVISARNTSTVYKVDRTTGAVLWRLGGKYSTFKMGPGTTTVRQHDARVHPGGLITMFDNGGGPPRVHGHSRGLFVRVDTIHRTANFVRELDHSPQLPANFEGNVQLLPNGDSFLGWGQQPYMTEFDARGRTVFDGHFVGANATYRAYRFQWSGLPHTLPAVAASRSGKSTVVYASWNGATAVASWRVLAGASPSSIKPVAGGARRSFETRITARGIQRYVAVQALDASGHLLGSSITVAAH